MATGSTLASTSNDSQADFDSSHLIHVQVTFIESVDKMFLIRSDDEARMESIRNWLSELDSDQYLHPKDINPLMPCIALYKDCWYRARVISMREDGDIFVEYVDYGNLESVKITDIRRLPDEPLIRSTNRLSQPCRLTGNCSVMDEDQFREILDVYYDRLRIKVDTLDEDTGQYSVTMYFLDDNGRLKNVNQAISSGSSSLDGQMGVMPKNHRTSMSTANGAAGSTCNGVSSARNGFHQNDASECHTTSDSAGIQAARAAVAEFQDDNGSYHQQAMASMARINFGNGNAHGVANGSIVHRDGRDAYDQVETATGFNRTNHGFNSAFTRCRSELDDVLHGATLEDDDDDDSSEEDGAVAAPYDFGIRERVRWSVPRAEDESTARLRLMWAHRLALRYPNKDPPPVQCTLSEQPGFVTHVTSPTSFYVQTVNQKSRFTNLEVAMNDFLSSDADPIPDVLVEAGICCAVFNEKKNVWQRGLVLDVYRDGRQQPTANVQLVDVGMEERFSLDALKPIPDQFVRGYPAAVYHVRLGGKEIYESIIWEQKHTEMFRSLVTDKTLFVKFLLGTPVAEVELWDMQHRCKICCGRSSKNAKLCSVNDLMLQAADPRRL